MLKIHEIISATKGLLIRGDLNGYISGVSIDSRTIRSGDIFIAIEGMQHDGHIFIKNALQKEAIGIVISREDCMRDLNESYNSINIILVKDTTQALQDIASYYRRKFKFPLVAITGSNGKTTTKEMTAAVLSKKYNVLKSEGNLNNHWGVPLSLLNIRPRHEVAVVEMGMNKKGEIANLCRIADPNVGVVTNISNVHIEFLRSINGVKEAKKELIDYLGRDDTAILNSDDPLVKSFIPSVKGKTVTFGTSNGVMVRGKILNNYKEKGFGFELTIGDERISILTSAIGRFNLYNALGAAAVGFVLNMNAGEIKKGLEEFRPVSMRMQIFQSGNKKIINDTYNANVSSVEAALDVLSEIGREEIRIAVLGDMLELGDYSEDAHKEVGRKVASMGIDMLVTTGQLSRFICDEAIKNGLPSGKVNAFDDHDEALKFLIKYVRNPATKESILIKGSRGMKMEKIFTGLMDFLKQNNWQPLEGDK